MAAIESDNRGAASSASGSSSRGSDSGERISQHDRRLSTVSAGAVETGRSGRMSRVDVLAGVGSIALGFFNFCKMRSLRLCIKKHREEINIMKYAVGETALIQYGMHNESAYLNEDVQGIIGKQEELATSFQEGVEEVRERLEELHGGMKSGFRRVIAAIRFHPEKETYRKLLMKTDLVTLSYRNIISAFSFRGRRYPEYVKRDTDEARYRAEKLYFYAKSFMFEDPIYQVDPIKKIHQDSLQYIIAMALAVRVDMDACLVESEMMDYAEDREMFMYRSRRLILEYIGMLARQIVETMSCISLLDLVLDFHLHLAMYTTFVKSFCVSLDLIASPDAKHCDEYMWDDGLTPIRDVLYREPPPRPARGQGRAQAQAQAEAEYNEGQDTRIELSSLEEKLWWVEFTGAAVDAASVDESSLKSSVSAKDLFYALGGTEDDTPSSVRINAEAKEALLALKPISYYRQQLWHKVIDVLHSAGREDHSLTMDNFVRAQAQD